MGAQRAEIVVELTIDPNVDRSAAQVLQTITEWVEIEIDALKVVKVTDAYGKILGEDK